MTPDARQAWPGHRGPAGHGLDASTALRSEDRTAAAPAAPRPALGRPAAAFPPPGAPRPQSPRPGAPLPALPEPFPESSPEAFPEAGKPRLGAVAKRAGRDASIVGFIPLLAVLVAVVAGVYVAWRQGSAGGGMGGVLAGAALLAGAVARLLLPVRLAGPLAIRNRATDVLTLTAFGAGLLVTGLVLPR
jgi:Protein of unknown function (DUF3017)